MAKTAKKRRSKSRKKKKFSPKVNLFVLALVLTFISIIIGSFIFYKKIYELSKLPSQVELEEGIFVINQFIAFTFNKLGFKDKQWQEKISYKKWTKGVYPFIEIQAERPKNLSWFKLKRSFTPLAQKKCISLYFKKVSKKKWQIDITYNNITTHRLLFYPPKRKPILVILVDDLGYDLTVVRTLLELNLPLNYSILPFLPYTKEIAEWLNMVGAEILLHLPLEAEGHIHLNEQPGMLLLNMPLERLKMQLKYDIEAVPYIKGVNNHMGSKFTQNAKAMLLVLKEIKKRNLYFVDSFTTPKSVAYQVAQKIGVPSVKADLFLDNDQNPISIKRRLKQLTYIAKDKGGALGICHPYSTTLVVLKKELPKLITNFEFITISQFIPDRNRTSSSK